jgi:hypothetical protein
MDPLHESLKPFATKLLKALYFTKGSRFAAHRRLLKKSHISGLSVSMLSLYVIAASLLPIFLGPLPGKSANMLALATVIASVFIIVLSHITAGQNYYTRAERMLKCAQKISKIYYEFEQSILCNSLNCEFMDGIREKYAAILNDYSENNDDIDFLYYSTNLSTIDIPTQFWPKLWRFIRGRYYTIIYYLDISFFHLLLIAIPPILIISVILG